MAQPSFWTDTRLRPRGDSSHVFLADALQEVGQRLIGDTWTGEEATDALLSDPRVTEAVERYFQQKWGNNGEQGELPGTTYKYVDSRAMESWDRLNRAMDWIAAEGAEHRLVTKGRPVAGGDYFDLPPSVWNVEDHWSTRFRQCRLDQATYLFVTRQSLDKCLADLVAPVARTVRAEKDAERWLREEFAKPDTKIKNRSEFRDEALHRFPGLSGEAFSRAWGNATAAHPDRRTAGRKPGRKFS